jgi:hypothetical protein
MLSGAASSSTRIHTKHPGHESLDVAALCLERVGLHSAQVNGTIDDNSGNLFISLQQGERRGGKRAPGIARCFERRPAIDLRHHVESEYAGVALQGFYVSHRHVPAAPTGACQLAVGPDLAYLELRETFGAGCSLDRRALFGRYRWVPAVPLNCGVAPEERGDNVGEILARKVV